MRIIGIDPGKSGAIAVVDGESGKLLEVFSLTDQNEMEIAHYLHQLFILGNCIIFIEDVHSSPQQGTVSAFTFGRGFGLILGALYAFHAEVKKVRPSEWQGTLGCLSGGNKKVPFELAKKIYLFEHLKGTFNRSSADAVLIAHYGYKYMTHNKEAVHVEKDPFQY